MNKGLLLLMGLLASVCALAQSPADSVQRAKEREVKTSGLYLYGEAVGNTKQEATKMAQSALTSEINKEIVKNPEWQFAKTIEVKDVEYNTENIDLMRGNKYRVIAFIPKTNIVAIFPKNTPELKMADKKAEKKTDKKVDASSQPNPTETGTAPEPVASAEKKTTEGNFVVEEPAQSVHLVTPANQTPADLLSAILKCANAQQINKILADNKTNGKVAYGKMESLVNQSDAYIIVYKSTGEIVAILNKGAGATRKDLISGEMKGTEIYAGNKQTWFQLF